MVPNFSNTSWNLINICDGFHYLPRGDDLDQASRKWSVFSKSPLRHFTQAFLMIPCEETLLKKKDRARILGKGREIRGSVF